MSNEFAIAAVTRTLRNILNSLTSSDFADLPEDARPTAEILITTLPLDKIGNGENAKNQINLYLYHSMPNAAWRNKEMPSQTKPGEIGFPPLALNLFYLINAYGQDSNELIGHVLLGKAMAVIHDHSVLGRAEIENAMAASELHNQIERVRITPQPISLDETSKLWAGLQTEYRLSAAYEVSVVLIESKRPARAPLPVLTRGLDDEGVTSQPSLIPPFPTIDSVVPQNNQPSAYLEDELTISGHYLAGDSLVVRFMNPLLTDPIEVSPLSGGTDTKIRAQLPNEPANWIAGVYTLEVVISKAGEPERTTNGYPFALAPKITTAPPITVGRSPGGDASITLTCSPQVRPEQRVVLLLGDREILAQPHPVQTGSLTFLVTDAVPGDYYVRLRIDGVDSLLVDRDATPPVFNETQKITIT